MPVSSRPQLLDRLEGMKGQFGPAHARQAGRLLERAGRLRFRDPESLIRFHEALLFLRAFPPNASVLRQTEAELSSFHFRVDALRTAGVDLSPLEPMEVSGIAGTAIEDCLNYDVARWLRKRFPTTVDVVWDGYEKHTRLAETLPRFLPLLDDDAYVEADVPYVTWLRSARGRRGRDLAWLLSQFERLPLAERERAELFDALELTVRWELGNLRASRTRNWQTVRRVFYHKEPFIRRGAVDLVKEITGPPLRVERLSRQAGGAVLDLMREIMTVRRRELWGTTYGDPAHVLRADVGRGLQIFLWGLPPERRLPLRAYVAGFSLKNGVPINYIEAIGLCEWLEVGFNTFYTFRDGESAWNYSQALRLLHQILGVTCVAVYPYQIGLDNEEAIESGAFWFYRKLGFRPGRPELARISEREEQKMAATPGYRTPAAHPTAIGHGPHVPRASRNGAGGLGPIPGSPYRFCGPATHGRTVGGRRRQDASRISRQCLACAGAATGRLDRSRREGAGELGTDARFGARPRPLVSGRETRACPDYPRESGIHGVRLRSPDATASEAPGRDRTVGIAPPLTADLREVPFSSLTLPTVWAMLFRLARFLGSHAEGRHPD